MPDPTKTEKFTPPKSPEELNLYYNLAERGTKAPNYSMAEARYRSARLTELQSAFVIREQQHQELNMQPYSTYDLVNFQCDLAFNPPKTNPADSRYVTGYVREKDLTIDSIIKDMNFKPNVEPYDKTNKLVVEACQIFTAKIKQVLTQSKFKEDLGNMIHLMVSRGNVFVDIKKQEKWHVKKIRIGNTKLQDALKKPITWQTIYEKICDYCSIDILPNTAVFPQNMRGGSNKEQPRLYTVRHYPIAQLAQRFKNNPRWDAVPKTPPMTIPNITNGVWGDYYLKLPLSDYGELITMQSEMFNEYNEWVNGVQMFPVQDDGTGYPLSEVSPSGEITICKGDYEKIPFFYFSKSNPDKNFVKEEQLNEIGRLMILFLRQKATPPIGNNSNKVLQSNMWNPGMVISDMKKEDISILTPNAGIAPAEFSFFKMISEDIDNTSVDPTVEGGANPNMTLGQYNDQKKESLKKLGLSIDNFTDFLREVYWKILDNEISYIDQKVKKYNPDNEEFEEAYNSFSAPASGGGKKGHLKVNLMDDTSKVDLYQEAQKEAKLSGTHRSMFAKPKVLKDVYTKMRNQIKMEVLSEPEGEQVTLLGFLFNLLVQYKNLKGDVQKVNFDYLETLISDNSGFDPTKVFLDEPLQPPTPQPNMNGATLGAPGSAPALGAPNNSLKKPVMAGM